MRKPLSQAEIEQRREAAKARWNKPGARRPKATILVGPPGSGKTTWVRANAKNAVVVSTDEFIDEYAKQHGLTYKQAFERVNHSRLQEKALERYDMAIKEGWDVVVDRTNMKRSSRQRFLDRTPPHYETEAVVFDVPREELFRRLRERKAKTGKEVSPGIVNTMLAQYEKPDTSEFDRIVPAGVGGARRVRRMEVVRRSTLRANPDTLFVFGDNLEGWGLGGQAKEMRGEPNAFGIPTKRSPRLSPDAFFTDADFEYFKKRVSPQFEVLRRHVRNGGSVVIPKDGIGTGLAQLPRRAPKIWRWLNEQFETLDKNDAGPLAKREKGSPLSEAELKQRKDAANARWGNVVAGATVGAAVGGAAGAGYAAYEHGQRRSLAFRYAVREKARKKRGLEAVETRQAERLKNITRYQGKATDSIGSVGSKRVGPDIDLTTASRKDITEASRKAGWPVAQYQRFLERSFGQNTRGMNPEQKEALRQGTVIQRGAKMGQNDIAQVLERQGFERVSVRPNQPGMFQIQGDVVRVNPRKGNPYSIDLFGDEIEGIFETKPGSNLRGRQIPSVRVGGLPTWEETISGARPPYEGLREGHTKVRSGAYKGGVRPKVSEIMETLIDKDGEKIFWTQKRREGKDAALMRSMSKDQRLAYFFASQEAKDKGLEPPSLKQFMKNYSKGAKPPRRQKIDVKMAGSIGDSISLDRHKVRYQGTPNDEALDAMRRNMFDNLKQRFKQMSENASKARIKGRERVLNRAKSELKQIIQYGKFKPKAAVARAAPFVVGGALAGATLGYLSGRKNNVEKLAKADIPRDVADRGEGGGGERYNRAELSLAAAIARTMRMWFEDPETADPEALMETTKPVIDAFNAGVSIQDKILGDLAEGRQKILAFHFDARNPRVERAAREHQLRLVGNLADTQMKAIQQALTDHAIRGGTPEGTARAIRESIGLTPTQARHVAAYRLELETLHPGVLRRALRDKRFDSTVSKALESKERIPQEKIDKMVDAYHRRYIAYRSMTIARTETIRAANSGAVASTQAALDAMPDMTVVKTWVATNDAKTRPDHKAMDGKSVLGMSTPFMMPDGSMVQFPHDPNAPADQTINCRCTVTFRLVPRANAANQFVAETVN